MRNILVYPDGSQQDFMYPKDREVEVGTQFQCEDIHGGIHVFYVIRIRQEGKCLFYDLAY